MTGSTGVGAPTAFAPTAATTGLPGSGTSPTRRSIVTGRSANSSDSFTSWPGVTVTRRPVNTSS